MTVKFTPNHAGIDAVIRGAGVRALLDAAASNVVSAVEDRAPRRTGTFAGSITKTHAGLVPRGVGITVYSTDWAAHLVEFGSMNNPAYAPFRRAASALGLRLTGEGRRR